jgi:hypothetical protein
MTDQWTAGLTPAPAFALRRGFADDAELYQRTRPVCPVPVIPAPGRLVG